MASRTEELSFELDFLLIKLKQPHVARGYRTAQHGQSLKQSLCFPQVRVIMRQSLRGRALRLVSLWKMSGTLLWKGPGDEGKL